MTAKKPGAIIGRPKTERGTPAARQLGRVHDDEWAELQSAAEASGMTFTQWAVGILLRAARRSRRTKSKTT